MKKTKIIVPALGMLLLSTAASVTGTVAWFAANTTVSATAIQVKAKAEGGIAIGAYTLTSASAAAKSGQEYYNQLNDAVYAAPAAYADTATVGLAAAELYPTSTGNASAWYHGTSVDMASYASTNQAALTAANLKTDGQYFNGTGASAETQYELNGQYFLYNKFSVKSTNSSNFSLWVSAITVTGESNSAALNKSLRLAIKVSGESVAFFAPMYAAGSADTLYYYNGSSRTAGTPAKGAAPKTKIANDTITPAGVDMEIWAYYEGEDENCNTINATTVTVDTLNISVSFTSVQPAA